VTALGVVAALLIAGFVALGRYLGSLDMLRQRSAVHREINIVAGKRLLREWDAMPLRHSFRADPSHAYAGDLNLFGHASLFQMLDTTATSTGQQTLRRWLLAGAAPPVVRERQAAVMELASQLDLRQELQVRGRLAGDVSPDPEPFLAWVESGPWLSRQRAFVWSARVSPIALCVLLAAQIVGLVAAPIWVLPLAANIGLWWVGGTRAQATLRLVAAHEGAYRRYADMFALLGGCSFSAPLLEQRRAVLTPTGASAADRLRRLSQFILPGSALVYWIVQRLFLWDIHVLAALENWQAAVGVGARAWLDTLSEFEALAALAGRAYDNPE